MALVFPPSPNPGDTYSDVGRTWTWDGTMWSLTTPIAIDVANVANAVPTSRTISTSGTGLSGGGDLTADRTITLDPTALAQDPAIIAVGQRECRSDFVDPYSYIGIAPVGSAESAAVWKITRIEIVGNTITVTVATNVKWDDRLTETYV